MILKKAKWFCLLYFILFYFILFLFYYIIDFFYFFIIYFNGFFLVRRRIAPTLYLFVMSSCICELEI